MSKLSFRARALDAAKPLPIYRNKDLPDLTDCVSINRAVPQMPTGMEKEEESEHHLQRAISAQQVFREKKESMVIPVPEAESNITYYDRLYKGEFRIPKQLIHIQPLGLDNELPDYDMDSEDETLLNRLNRKMELRPVQFETMMDRLEKASTNQLVTLQEAKLLLNEDDYLLKSVYDYWVRKRKNCRGPSLIPQIKQEKRDGSTNNDAYVAFRRRTEKMQTRKNRKNDEASYEKMLKLRREFSRTMSILEMIKKREKSKRELLHLTLEVFEKRYQIGDFSGEVLNEVTVPLAEKTSYSAATSLPMSSRHKAESKMKSYKSGPKHLHPFTVKPEPHFDFVRSHKKYNKRPKLDTFRQPGRPERQQTIIKADIKQYDFHSSGEEDYPLSPASEPDEENDPDGNFAFRRKAGCSYLSPLVDQSCSPHWQQADQDRLWQRNCLTALSVPKRCIAVAHRRVGRGGRVVFDRTSSELDRALRHLDPDMFYPSAGSSVPDLPVHTNTYSHIFKSTPDCSLTQLLNDIQACRWKFFRPRPLQDNSRSEDKKGTPQVEKGGGTPLSNSVSGGFTEEQFHSHQQQLVQMHKQLQQQELQQNSTAPEPHKPLPNTASSDCMSKTLDSASAHFAASAVVNTPNNENRPQIASVNGILSNSGIFRQAKLNRSAGGGESGSLVRMTSASGLQLPVPQSLPHGHGHLSTVSAVSPAHTHHSARLCAPSPSALKLASVASSLDRVPKVTPTSAIDIARENHEPERLALNGLSETTVAMEVT
ncbi:enhancer of polycomb homolog 2 isoform X2 [Rhinichthys klamathensis goyatoka]|uniref:enhancer of polycomb homolog 2 isoform X2 n=1 Tax=Rhinichthys klamathensis goyatoka TaxID=3034132 RepID=UPI0024B62453|nr:enhancer of polycomb homolog 2 isoform X2 [Rhinichthys klamathensis goyatoka]